MTEYTLEETKNMSRALRHADYSTFRNLLKADERFTPWLDAIESEEWERIHFEWLDAQWIKEPLNDVESIVISAIGDGLIDAQNWSVAYNCLTRLPSSSKAQRKRNQVMDNYVNANPNVSIENAYVQRAISFYSTNTHLPVDFCQKWKTYYELVKIQYESNARQQALAGMALTDVPSHPLDALAILQSSLEAQHWQNVASVSKRLSHALDESGAYAWLSWFAEQLTTDSTPKEAAILLAWSMNFWPLISDPLKLRDQLQDCFPEALQIIQAKDDPSQSTKIEDTQDDKNPATAIFRAMLTDNAKAVIQNKEAREKLSSHPVVSSIIAAWLDIMDHPTKLAQTVRSSLRTHPSIFILYQWVFTHELIADNERIAFAKQLFPMGDNACLMLGQFSSRLSSAFNPAQQRYIELIKNKMIFESASTSSVNTQIDVTQPDHSQSTSLVKRNKGRIIVFSAIGLACLYLIIRGLMQLI